MAIVVVEKWKDTVPKIGPDDKSVLVQFKKCAAVE
jgi:hypothetical protein